MNRIKADAINFHPPSQFVSQVFSVYLSHTRPSGMLASIVIVITE